MASLAFPYLIRLHVIVLLSSLVPSIILSIKIPAVEIVFFRMLIASFFLGIFIAVEKCNYRFSKKETIQLLGSGILTSIYWILLFISAKIANASISLIGIATTAIWTSLLSPFISKNSFSKTQLIVAANAFVGIWIIAYSEGEYATGLLVGVIGGFFAALLTIINAIFSKKYEATVITFYQMLGGLLGTIIFIPFYLIYFSHDHIFHFPSVYTDWLYILLLVFVFSIFIYSEFIFLMKSLSPFLVALTANLSPIYGMIAALVIFGKSEMMEFEFYLGTFLIIISVLTYPLLRKMGN